VVVLPVVSVPGVPLVVLVPVPVRHAELQLVSVPVASCRCVGLLLAMPVVNVVVSAVVLAMVVRASVVASPVPRVRSIA
jgi:hypothetical protein